MHARLFRFRLTMPDSHLARRILVTLRRFDNLRHRGHTSKQGSPIGCSAPVSVSSLASRRTDARPTPCKEPYTVGFRLIPFDPVILLTRDLLCKRGVSVHLPTLPLDVGRRWPDHRQREHMCGALISPTSHFGLLSARELAG